MKQLRLLVSCAAMILFTAQGLAQTVVNDQMNTVTQPQQQTKESKSGSTGMGYDIEYQFTDFEWGIGASMVISNFVLGFDWDQTSSGPDNMVARGGAYLGYVYHMDLSDSFFLEGRLALNYHDYRVEINGNNNHNWEFGLQVAPRVGFNLSSHFNVFASYRLDFTKFKFNKENTADYLTAGIGFRF